MGCVRLFKERVRNIMLAAKGKPWPASIVEPPPIIARTYDVHTLATVVRFENASNPWVNTVGESTAKAEAAAHFAELLLECGAIELTETERHPGIFPGTTSVWYGARLRVYVPEGEV